MPQINRIAIITGGAQGIGKSITKAFLEKGWTAVIADTDREAGEETAREFDTLGTITFIQTDVSEEKQVERLVEKTILLFGRIDALINNAGISINKPLTTLTIEEWNRVLGTNLTGIFLCAKHSCSHLQRVGGCIINIASTRAFMSEACTEAYSASKGGVVALTHALAVSLGSGIRVNCISPGWIETGLWKKKSRRITPALSAEDHLQHPAGRVGTPEDISSLVLYLVSTEASFLTGSNLIADGGMTRKMMYS
ncbi:MAG: glucose 1-dehydrogenase [Geobacteraceae bacterium]|nr:glucose 1-dehydrogenase [Geobacteraceae bacterium]